MPAVFGLGLLVTFSALMINMVIREQWALLFLLLLSVGMFIGLQRSLRADRERRRAEARQGR